MVEIYQRFANPQSPKSDRSRRQRRHIELKWSRHIYILVLKFYEFVDLTMYIALCSIEFDCDDDLFATAGVSRRIKVFDFSAVRWMTFNFYFYF